MSTPIPLTDSPAIVELKRKFRAFDEEEEELKSQLLHMADLRRFAETALECIRQGKRDVARQIFAVNQQPPTKE